ncbi:MAG: large ribosomal subunit protein bL35 [Dehalococcoidia bacterium]
MKTNSASKRRFSITATGKVMRMKGNKRHKKMAKSRRVLQTDEHKFPVAPTHRRKLQRLLPYGV